MLITNRKSTSFKVWVCCLFLCGRSNLDLRTKQACEIYVTFTAQSSEPLNIALFE